MIHYATVELVYSPRQRYWFSPSHCIAVCSDGIHRTWHIEPWCHRIWLTATNKQSDEAVLIKLIGNALHVCNRRCDPRVNRVIKAKGLVECIEQITGFNGRQFWLECQGEVDEGALTSVNIADCPDDFECEVESYGTD